MAKRKRKKKAHQVPSTKGNNYLNFGVHIVRYVAEFLMNDDNFQSLIDLLQLLFI